MYATGLLDGAMETTFGTLNFLFRTHARVLTITQESGTEYFEDELVHPTIILDFDAVVTLAGALALAHATGGRTGSQVDFNGRGTTLPTTVNGHRGQGFIEIIQGHPVVSPGGEQWRVIAIGRDQIARFIQVISDLI